MAFEPQSSIARTMNTYGGRIPSYDVSRSLSAGFETGRRRRETDMHREELDIKKRLMAENEKIRVQEKFGAKAAAIMSLPEPQRVPAWDSFRSSVVGSGGKDPGGYSEQNMNRLLTNSVAGQEKIAAEQEYQRSLASGTAESMDEATIKRFNFRKGLTNQKDIDMWNNQLRAPQTISLGGTQAVLGTGGEINQQYPVTPKPEQMPAFKQQQAEATATGSAIGTATATATTELAEMQARLPRLEQVAAELSALGKAATYTYAGQGVDFAARQSGFGATEGAIARAEYISKVDNEVLPLLRQTFGAQFTVQEGESLKATLGDANKSPEEKDAVLRSFVGNKIAEIETKARNVTNLQQTGVQGYIPEQPEITQEDLEFTAQKHGITVEEVMQRLGIQ